MAATTFRRMDTSGPWRTSAAIMALALVVASCSATAGSPESDLAGSASSEAPSGSEAESEGPSDVEAGGVTIPEPGAAFEAPTDVDVPLTALARPYLDRLADLGVDVQITEETVGSWEAAGTILSVEPEPGSTVLEGSRVTVTIAKADPADVGGALCDLDFSNGEELLRVLSTPGILLSGQTNPYARLLSQGGCLERRDELTRVVPDAAPWNEGMDMDETRTITDPVELELDACARGTVTNNTATRKAIFVEVDYFDGAGVVVDQGIDSLSLDSGETGRWESRTSQSYERCRARLSGVFED